MTTYLWSHNVEFLVIHLEININTAYEGFLDPFRNIYTDLEKKPRLETREDPQFSIYIFMVESGSIQ